MENFVKEESETDDQEELESFLYSQIHYMEDNPEEETPPPPPVQSRLVGDVKPISNHKIEDETMRVSLIYACKQKLRKIPFFIFGEKAR